MSELLPCAHCGCAKIWLRKEYITQDPFKVWCDNCTVELWAETEELAIQRWNTRAQPIAYAKAKPGSPFPLKLLDSFGCTPHREAIDAAMNESEAGRTERTLPDNQVWVLYAGDETNPVGFTHDDKWAGEWVNQLECRFAKIVRRIDRAMNESEAKK